MGWNDSGMESEMIIALVLGVTLVASGTIGGLLALWMRLGASGASRFWVRQRPIESFVSYPAGEPAVLVVLPMLAQSLVMAGAICPLIPFAGQAWASAVLFAALGLEILLWIVALMSIVNRWIIPLWLYPSWLRPARRAERERLRAARRA